jgi:RNA polymerase sigma-70 factor (ECF subfamily)
MTDENTQSWSERVVNRFERPLLAYACRMLGGDWSAAQDAVQETFLRLCRAERESIEPRLAAWLFTVCRSRVIDMQRTQNSLPQGQPGIDFPDPSPGVSQSLCDAEDKTHLNDCLARLTPRQQEVLRLRLAAGLSYREIADVTGMTVSNVGFHLHEAVRSLRQIITT